MSEEGLEQSVNTNLILGIDTGDGCQDSFEGTEYSGRSPGEIEGKCSTPKSPVNQASLPD